MNYRTSERIVSKIVGDELIIIQLDTGRYHYFTKETVALLEDLKEEKTLGSDFVSNGNSVIQSLVDRKIVELSKSKKGSPTLSRFPMNVQFLRDGERTIDQISFASP